MTDLQQATLTIYANNKGMLMSSAVELAKDLLEAAKPVKEVAKPEPIIKIIVGDAWFDNLFNYLFHIMKDQLVKEVRAVSPKDWDDATILLNARVKLRTALVNGKVSIDTY